MKIVFVIMLAVCAFILMLGILQIRDVVADAFEHRDVVTCRAAAHTPSVTTRRCIYE